MKEGLIPFLQCITCRFHQGESHVREDKVKCLNYKVDAEVRLATHNDFNHYFGPDLSFLGQARVATFKACCTKLNGYIQQCVHIIVKHVDFC